MSEMGYFQRLLAHHLRRDVCLFPRRPRDPHRAGCLHDSVVRDLGIHRRLLLSRETIGELKATVAFFGLGKRISDRRVSVECVLRVLRAHESSPSNLFPSRWCSCLAHSSASDKCLLQITSAQREKSLLRCAAEQVAATIHESRTRVEAVRRIRAYVASMSFSEIPPCCAGSTGSTCMVILVPESREEGAGIGQMHM